jgi:epoxyqueuosine reductase QueG
METAHRLVEQLTRFVAESPANRHPDGSGPYFDAPLVGFAAAGDPLFEEYKGIIGAFHRTPREVFEESHGVGSLAAGTVIVWILPITAETRRSNREQTRVPSVRWAHTRAFGERFNSDLRRHAVACLHESGHRAAAPLLVPSWRMVDDPAVGLASTWSERHAAYAAGLGTFSLNDGFITPRGIAHRVGSVVTDLVLPPSGRPYPDHRHNCLFHREGTCGACIGRCPAGALSEAGHDKEKCRRHVYGTVVEEVGAALGITEAGCGLCQTAVPCEGRIPRGKGAS